MVPSLLFVIGASGAGKTAAVRLLAARNRLGVRCYHFDSIGVPSADVMERQWGSGEVWQEHMTKEWIARLAKNADAVDIAVLEGQTRPSFITAALPSAGIRCARTVLLDCTADARATRLRGSRGQPELASERMNGWAAYLRGQADALGLPMLDTSTMSLEDVVDRLEEEIESLRGASGAAA